MSLLLPIFQGLIVLNSTITYLSRLNSSNELYYVSLLPIFQGLIEQSSLSPMFQGLIGLDDYHQSFKV